MPGAPCACRSVSTVAPDAVGRHPRQLRGRMRRQTPNAQRHHTKTTVHTVMREGTLGERESEHARQRDLQPNPRRLGLALAREWCGRSAGDGGPLGANAFVLSEEERGMMI